VNTKIILDTADIKLWYPFTKHSQIFEFNVIETTAKLSENLFNGYNTPQFISKNAIYFEKSNNAIITTLNKSDKTMTLSNILKTIVNGWIFWLIKRTESNSAKNESIWMVQIVIK